LEQTGPRAIYYEGSKKRTYFVYAKQNFDVYITFFDHETGELSQEVCVSTEALDDCHATPCVGVLPNGKIIVFWRRDTPEIYHLYYKISGNAEDISSWSSEYDFGYPYTRPSILTFSDKLVVFAREIVSGSWARYIRKETTNGTSWTQNPAGYILDFGDGNWPYMVFHKKDPQSDRVFMSGMNCLMPSGSFENVYFAYSDDRGVAWKKANGSAMTLPMTDAQCKIITEGDSTLYPWAVQDENNRFIINYFKVDVGTPENKVRIAQWNGSAWTAYTALDENNAEIKTNSIQNQYSFAVLDSETGRPAFYHVKNEDQRIRRYVRKTGETYKFQQTWISGKHMFGTKPSKEGRFYCFFQPVQNGSPVWEMIAEGVGMHVDTGTASLTGRFYAFGYTKPILTTFIEGVTILDGAEHNLVKKALESPGQGHCHDDGKSAFKSLGPYGAGYGYLIDVLKIPVEITSDALNLTFTNTTYADKGSGINFNKAKINTDAPPEAKISYAFQALLHQATVAQTTYAKLYDLTDGDYVGNSEISRDYGYAQNVTSPKIRLIDGHDYIVRTRVSGGTGRIYEARILVFADF